MKKEAQIDIVHIIVAVMLLAGGFLFLINQSALGGIIETVGLLIEIIINWIK